MKKDVDLGNGVFIGWVTLNGIRIGGILTHPKKDEPNMDGECSGTFWFKDKQEYFSGRTTWEFNNDFEKPTLSPSFLCHCGFHGFIKEGKWIQA